MLRMKKVTIVGCLMAAVVVGLGACGNKGASEYPYSTKKEAKTFDKHSQEYISQRIDTIYAHKDDSLCCSEAFLKMDGEAQAISKNHKTVYRDADHWVIGQDIDHEWRYELQQVNILSDSTATVTLNIHNFEDQKVVLDLVFERDDWFVDNFHIFFEGQDYDEDGNPLPDSEGTKEVNEVQEIQKYIKNYQK